jgi:hypothetical protein
VSPTTTLGMTIMRFTASTYHSSVILVCWHCFFIGHRSLFHAWAAPASHVFSRPTVAYLLPVDAAASVAANKNKKAAVVPFVAVPSRISTRRPYRRCSGFQKGFQLHDTMGTLSDVIISIHSSSSALAAGTENLLDFTSISGSSTGSNWFIWPLRLTSAVLSYVALIGFFDRPRGELLVTLDDMIEIKTSNVPGAGLGLFAKVPLPKGTVLGTYPGVMVPLAQNLPKLQAFPACEGYIWRFSDNRFVIDPTNEQGEIEDACRFGGNPSLPGSIWLCRNIIPLFLDVSVGTALCRINEPPRGRDVNVVTNEDPNARAVTFILERDVWPDEEFYIDYGLSYDRSRYGGGGAPVVSEVVKKAD